MEQAEDAIKAIYERRAEKHRNDQVRIDAGECDDFDTDDF
jgi:hypothetical protein